MEFVHEVTAYLENKPGRLAKICSALAHEKIDIKALSVMDKSERSVFRFVTDDLEPTKKVLTSLGVEFTGAEVLAVTMDNQPGSLARVLERLAEEHINVEYAYTSCSAPGKAVGVFQTSNSKRALQVLNEASPNGVDRAAGRRPLHTR
ncbi:ACT domain-containing protein [Singulisphaera sp. Ch08]|uniref:ACT domain-containing protein n=1 Tax=Singulisphaera sp. Ch08 TaxID=3120278 RepID=A0AAU7CG56_9BACT